MSVTLNFADSNHVTDALNPGQDAQAISQYLFGAISLNTQPDS